MKVVGALPRNMDDYRQRGAEATHRTKMPVEERNRRRKKSRATLVSEMMLNKEGPRVGAKGGNSSDLFVVSRRDLLGLAGPVLDMQTKAACGSAGNILVGGHLYLASELGTHVDVVRNLFRNVHLPWVSFGLADDILTVLNMPMAFHDGRVPVYVNPRISYKTWCRRAKAQDVDCPAELWLLHSHPEAWAA